MRGFPVDGSRWLQTPCALRLGGPNPTSQPLTPSVAPWVLPRDVPSHVRRCPPGFRQKTNTPRRQDPVRRHPVRGNAALEPRVPSVGSISTLRPSEAFHDPCYVRAKDLASVRPKRSPRPVKGVGPLRATPCNLGLPRGSPWWRGEDASPRHLQPTLDTSTRGPFDFRARSLRRADRRVLPEPVRVRCSRATSDHLAAIQPRLGTRLTARLQLRPLAHGPVVPFGSTFPSAASLGGATLAWRFLPCSELARRPLTLPVAPRDAARCYPDDAHEEPGSLLPPPRQ
jgi:hypothetical protein